MRRGSILVGTERRAATYAPGPQGHSAANGHQAATKRQPTWQLDGNTAACRRG
jgi:hypothetical protein